VVAGQAERLGHQRVDHHHLGRLAGLQEVRASRREALGRLG
jgi:hypothetical protein